MDLQMWVTPTASSGTRERQHLARCADEACDRVSQAGREATTSVRQSFAWARKLQQA